MSFLTSLFAHTETPTLITSPLDMVTRTASLASNPDEIDPLLDDVRAITARLDAGQMPTSTDAHTLFTVYLKLESYLTNHETLRIFTPQQLRARLSPELQQQITAFEAH
jgi:hypothetical protein